MGAFDTPNLSPSQYGTLTGPSDVLLNSRADFGANYSPDTSFPTMPSLLPAVSEPNNNKILGMTPNNFSAMFGGIASAVAPKDSWQQKLGALAQNLGMTQLKAEVEKNKFNSQIGSLKLLLKDDPNAFRRIALALGTPHFDLFGGQDTQSPQAPSQP